MKKNLGSIFITLTIIFIFIAFFVRNYSDSLIIIFGSLALACSIGFLFTKSNETKNKKNEFIEKSNLFVISNKINNNKTVFSDTELSRLIFDHENQNIYILKVNNEHTSLPYSSILESELMENGNTLTKTSRTSQLGGVLVGGVLGGLGGAVIGGLSAKQTSSQNINTLQIKINTSDKYSPTNSFFVKESKIPLKKESTEYSKLYEQAYEIHKIISAIINEQENNIV